MSNLLDTATLSQRLFVATWQLEGCVYTLNLLANERTEATHAIRNQMEILERVFSVMFEIAESLEDGESKQETRV